MRMLPHTITIQVPSSTVDSNGDPTSAGSQSTLPARVQLRNDIVRGPDMKDIVTSHTIYTATAIAMGTRIWCTHLGDDTDEIGDARYPLAVGGSPSLSGGQVLYKTFL